MPDLGFQIDSAHVVPFAASPMLAFRLHIRNGSAGEKIQTIALRCLIQIEVTRRRYEPQEQERLRDLFGHPDRWSQTLRGMLWTHASVMVPGFKGASTVVDLPVPRTFDFKVAATKYFDGLADGEIPLNMLFSGTVFYAPSDSPLQVAPISWDQEARFKLPVKVWREMMESYYPNSVWVNLRQDTEVIFLRQLMAQARPGDVAIGISTSGGSRNIVMALEEARERKLLTVALLGNDGGEIACRGLADFPIIDRSDYIPRIARIHRNSATGWSGPGAISASTTWRPMQKRTLA